MQWIIKNRSTLIRLLFRSFSVITMSLNITYPEINSGDVKWVLRHAEFFSASVLKTVYQLFKYLTQVLYLRSFKTL